MSVIVLTAEEFDRDPRRASALAVEHGCVRVVDASGGAFSIVVPRGDDGDDEPFRRGYELGDRFGQQHHVPPSRCPCSFCGVARAEKKALESRLRHAEHQLRVQREKATRLSNKLGIKRGKPMSGAEFVEGMRALNLDFGDIIAEREEERREEAAMEEAGLLEKGGT